MTRLLPQLENRDDVVLVDRLYKIEEAAALLGYDSANYLYDLIREGKTEYVDLNPNGKRPAYRMRASQINNLVESMTFGVSPLRSVA